MSSLRYREQAEWVGNPRDEMASGRLVPAPVRGIRVEISCAVDLPTLRQEQPPAGARADPLREMALLWERQGCPEGLLLEGAALDRAAAYAAAHASDLLDQERDLLERSQQAAERTRGLQRQSALLRALLTVVVLAGVAAMHLVLQAREQAAAHRQAEQMWQQELSAAQVSLAAAQARATIEAEGRLAAERDRAVARQRLLAELEAARAGRSRSLVNASGAAVGDDRDLALLLAVEAARLWPGDGAPADVQAALFRALGHARWEEVLIPTAGAAAPAAAWLGPDGRVLALDADGRACLWDASSGQRLLTLEGADAGVQRVAWSGDGHRLALLLPAGAVHLWDAELGTPGAALEGDEGPVMDLAWSPGADRLLTLHLDGHVVVWDATTGRRLLELRDLPGTVAGQWAAEGAALVLYQGDGTITRRAAATGEVLSVIAGPQEELSRFLASRRAGSLAYSLDGGEHIYLGATADLADLACARATRNLTPAEWQRHLGDDAPYRPTCPR